LARASGFAKHLSSLINGAVAVDVLPNYQALREALSRGEVDAVWAPPFVCARLETRGLKVAVRGVRDGASTYRAALVCRKNEPLVLSKLKGTRAAWVDHESVGGHLLVIAMLKDKGIDPWNVFREQRFLGSYREPLVAVLDGQADVASIFAAPSGDVATGIRDVLPEGAGSFSVVAFSDQSPNDGVVFGERVDAALRKKVSTALLAMHETDDGKQLLARMFRVERFEPAPASGYRSLYKLAVAGL
jgi:phosphonate transport system substrate-binding protein